MRFVNRIIFKRKKKTNTLANSKKKPLNKKQTWREKLQREVAKLNKIRLNAKGKKLPSNFMERYKLSGIILLDKLIKQVAKEENLDINSQKQKIYELIRAEVVDTNISMANNEHIKLSPMTLLESILYCAESEVDNMRQFAKDHKNKQKK